MKKWFHAIGVSGKTTANVAKMFKDMGWFVTGSDMQFLPPASDILVENGIHTAEGYNYKHLTREFWEKQLRITNYELRDKAGKNKIQNPKSEEPNEATNEASLQPTAYSLEQSKKGMHNAQSTMQNVDLDIPEQPDLGLIMSFLTPSNKEYRYAKLHNIDIRPYAKVLGEYLVKKNSIVVVGTAGKTTTTALITYILQNLGFNPSYMIGADVVNIPDSIQNTDSAWSVLEGDEYHSPELEGHAKFMEYKPKYLVITSIGWEHQDIFPTQESYIQEFKNVVDLVPEDGVIVAKGGDSNIEKTLVNVKCKIIRYSVVNDKSEIRNPKNQTVAQIASSTKAPRNDSLETHSSQPTAHSINYSLLTTNNSFKIYSGDKFILEGTTSLLGEYNLENIVAAVALITNLPSSEIDQNILVRGTQILKEMSQHIANFRGAKKRLEILFENENITIVDDFGVAPSRAINSLKTLKDAYPEHKIISVFEPNSGSRPLDPIVFSNMYKDAFDNADEVIIPSLSEFKDEFVDTKTFVERLESLKVKVEHVENQELVRELKLRITNYEMKQQKVLVVFFSSYRLTELEMQLVEELKG